MTKIQWTDRTWNPITGCQKFSPGCDHCYAEQMTRRLKTIGSSAEKYKAGFDTVVCNEDALTEPFKWRKPCRCFVCSMSDLFNRDVPEEFINKVFDVIRKCPHITFQILTKRAKRMSQYFRKHQVLPNVWIGVTAEDFNNDRLRWCNNYYIYLKNNDDKIHNNVGTDDYYPIKLGVDRFEEYVEPREEFDFYEMLRRAFADPEKTFTNDDYPIRVKVVSDWLKYLDKDGDAFCFTVTKAYLNVKWYEVKE